MIKITTATIYSLHARQVPALREAPLADYSSQRPREVGTIIMALLQIRSRGSGR